MLLPGAFRAINFCSSPVHLFLIPFTELNSHTRTTGLIFLQLAVYKTVSLAPNVTAPSLWGQSTYDMYSINSTIHGRGDTATGKIPYTYSFDFVS
jgi:hypothetical protein